MTEKPSENRVATIRRKLPIEPVPPERRDALRKLKGMILLGRVAGANAWHGYVENSFSMDWHTSYANFFFSRTGEAGGAAAWIADHHRHACLLRPDWDVRPWDVDDPDLPVTLDWDGWISAQARDPNTLAGVSDKFRARNFRFEMRGEA